jgi:FKBP-type peptidyl-prolyl cis-trans isomerase
MKKMFVVVAVAVFFAGQFSCGAKEGGTTKPAMKTFVEQYSYMIGLDIGRTLKSMNTEFDENALTWGITDFIKSRPELLTPKLLDSIKQAFSMIMQQKQMDRMKETGGKNLQEGQAFLTENKKQPGVITTASGLQYTIIKKGTGPKPKATDKVKVHYVGTLLDGKEFDSSIKRGQPAIFPINSVVPAWTEALQLMNVGSKYKLFVPPNLAYGERGAGQEIGPNAVLIFDVELLGIEK